MFDEISASYDRLNHILSGFQDKRWRKNTIMKLKSYNFKYNRILDLASGTGDLAIECLKLEPNIIFSADISAEMLKINKIKFPNKNNFILKAEAEYLPFNNQYFDLCTVGFGVRNFENIENCINEIYRVLNKNGKFATIEMFSPYKRNLSIKLFSYYFETIMPKLGNRISNSKYAYNYLFESVNKFITIIDYKKLLERYGFKVIYIKNNFLNIVNTVIAEKIY